MSSEPLAGARRTEAGDPFAGGLPVTTSASSPLAVAPAGHAWLLRTGTVEVFAHAAAPGGDAPRRHVASFEPGAFLFGSGGEGASGAAASLLAAGVGDATLSAFAPARLLPLAVDAEAAGRLEAGITRWVAALCEATALDPPPDGALPLAAGREVEVEGGAAVRAAEPLVWVRPLAGRLRWAGEPDLVFESGDHLIAVAGDAWLEADGEALVSTVSTRALLRSGRLWEELERFHRFFARALELAVERGRQAERHRLERRIELDEQALIGAQAGLASVLSSATDAVAGGMVTGEPLFAACRLVGEAQGIALRAPIEKPGGSRHPVAAVAAASRVRYRRVLLREDWWRRDNGPLVGFRQDGDNEAPRPVALLPVSHRRYRLVDPVAGTAVRVDAACAEGLVGEAYMFYPPLPPGPAGLTDLFRLAFRGRRKEVPTVVGIGIAGGLLALLVPLLTGTIFGRVIPSADQPQLVRLTLALVVAAVAGALFEVTRGLAVMRLGIRLDGALQPAVWDRLLSLPAGFFRRFTVGDLSERTMGIESIRRTLSGSATSAILGAVFSVFSFAILFWYSRNLALVASGLVALLLALSAWLAWLQLRHQRALLAVRGRIASLLLGFFHGLGKLRIAAAEERAYTRWAERFAEQRRLTLKAQRAANVQTVLNAVYAVGSILVIFAAAGWEAVHIGLEVSDFLAFSAALGQFQAAALTLLSLFSSLLLLRPIYERLQPVLHAEPEADPARLATADLEGELEVSHVSFRYQEDGPLVLEDVSLRARPGELVALVGPSGSGKSTLLRILLGFERPASGAVYLDGHDLSSLDPQGIRRQIGVVLQDGTPVTGDIFSNIVGTSGLGLDAAWEAAEMAGLAEDIREMPMGMHTVINEGAGTFSGGQRQRLLIARALVRHPKMVFFDEATSALDNRTQETVAKSLDRLEATRVVVAHRLSTIRHADRIYVLDRGRVAESGRYDELVAAGGLFARLVERQTL